MIQYCETERFILREFLHQDAEAFLELDSNPEVHRYLGNKPIATIEQSQETIEHVRRQYRENGIGRWAIVDKSTQQVIGWCGLKLIKDENDPYAPFYDIGYRLIETYWGRGIATECAHASLTYGFETLNLSEIYAAAHVENAASNKILHKLGFQLLESRMIENSLHNWYRLQRSAWKNT